MTTHQLWCLTLKGRADEELRRPLWEFPPERVYEPPGASTMCKYVHTDEAGNDSCGCVVSHIVHRLGVPLAELKKYEGRPAHTVLSVFFEFSPATSVARFADELQERQDSGMSWERALAHAEGYAPTGVVV